MKAPATLDEFYRMFLYPRAPTALLDHAGCPVAMDQGHARQSRRRPRSPQDGLLLFGERPWDPSTSTPPRLLAYPQLKYS